MPNRAITHNKTTHLSAVSAATVVEYTEIDLGLQVGMLARILEITLGLDTAPEVNKIAYGELAIRLDPEATTANIALGLDDIVAFLRQRWECGAAMSLANTFTKHTWDFTNQNFLVARNISMIGATTMSAGDAPAFNGFSMVRYELYRPSAQELNEIIAYRR